MHLTTYFNEIIRYRITPVRSKIPDGRTRFVPTIMFYTQIPDTDWAFPQCPQPNTPIDWDALHQQFTWLQDLADCPQDPIHHAEGDVLTHTKLVCEALVRLEGWRSLPPTPRNILFAAALLHDIAKPQTTKTDDEGRISARGHGRIGAQMARQVLQQLNTPFTIRETIVHLINQGSLPMWFWDKADPQRAVIKTSWLVSCRWVALLSEADVLGRHCHDQAQILESVQFFREFCTENQCLDQPYPFASDHSRFVYFHKDKADPTYAAYDDTQTEVILMCALPGSGKDHWIRQNCSDWPMVSLDEIRQEMGFSPKETPGEVIHRARDLAKGYLRSHTPFIWNATNLTQQLRSKLIQLFAGYNARIRIVYVEVSPETQRHQNRSRSAPVPNKVVRRMNQILEIPGLTEVHQITWEVQSSAINQSGSKP